MFPSRGDLDRMIDRRPRAGRRLFNRGADVHFIAEAGRWSSHSSYAPSSSNRRSPPSLPRLTCLPPPSRKLSIPSCHGNVFPLYSRSSPLSSCHLLPRETPYTLQESVLSSARFSLPSFGRFHPHHRPAIPTRRIFTSVSSFFPRGVHVEV